MSDPITHWDLHAFDLVYQRLKYRETPLTAAQCHELADILAEMILQHDGDIINRSLIAPGSDQPPLPVDNQMDVKVPTETYVWEFKKVTPFKNSYYIWIPKFTETAPAVWCVCGEYFMKLTPEMWISNAGERQLNDITFICFEWKPDPLQIEDKVVINKLKEANRLYTSFAKKEVKE